MKVKIFLTLFFMLTSFCMYANTTDDELFDNDEGQKNNALKKEEDESNAWVDPYADGKENMKLLMLNEAEKFYGRWLIKDTNTAYIDITGKFGKNLTAKIYENGKTLARNLEMLVGYKSKFCNDLKFKDKKVFYYFHYDPEAKEMTLTTTNGKKIVLIKK